MALRTAMSTTSEINELEEKISKVEAELGPVVN